MTYLIPTERIASLKRKVDSIANKGANVVFELIGEPRFFKDPELGVYYEAQEVEVEGIYKVEGWEFIAKIETSPMGNLIFKVKDIDIPEKYRNSGARCDHCNTVRTRNSTFLVRNLETGEFKQVGKACLLQYTDGLDATRCAELASLISFVRKNSFEDEEMLDYIRSHNAAAQWFDGDSIRKALYYIVSKYGYIKNHIVDQYYDLSKDELNSLKSIDLSDMNKWVDMITDGSTNDYYHNAKILWNSECLKTSHFTLVASLVNQYLKYKQDVARNKTIDYDKFQVGDKVSLVADTVKVLYTKSAYAYGAEPTYVQKIIGTDGVSYVWSTTNQVKKGDKINATVKELNTYRDERQVVITRGKIQNA